MTTEELLQQLIDRLTRLESRMVQLMIYEGMDPDVKYYKGE
jgi:hypothetical protein